VASLSERQEQIMRLVIQEYVTSPKPVSSRTLVENYDLRVSSATVRNDMAALEEMGFLSQPHTSAGRTPTDAGYRHVVNRLLHEGELPSGERHTIRHQFRQTPLDLVQWMRLAATILAETAQSVSLITSLRAVHNRYKHLALIATEGRLVLMVLVLESGDVHQQMLELAEPVAQESLTHTAEQLNRLCEGLTAQEVMAKASRLDVLEREVSQQAGDMIQRADSQRATIFHDGVGHILHEPEFEREGVLQTLRVLEERETLDDVLKVVLSPGLDDVQVMIGGEGRWEALSHCSIILSRYGVTGHSSGALGVMGPTRMQYGRAIPAVRFVSQVMSDLVENIYRGGDG
jgi:heat-inducible transcriptional repressor